MPDMTAVELVAPKTKREIAAYLLWLSEAAEALKLSEAEAIQCLGYALDD